MSQEHLQALLGRAGAEILADLPHMTEAELFGLYLFLCRVSGA